MNRQLRAATTWVLLATLCFTGCTAKQPFFLHEDGDLSHYLDTIQEIDYPDVQTAETPEATHSFEPLTILEPDFDNWWDLTLEEVISITLHNSKVIRNSGQVSQFGIADGLLNRTAAAPTVYDPGIAASNASSRPNVLSNPPGSSGAVGTNSRGIDPEQFNTAQTVGSVEDALAVFDAQFAAVYGMEHTDAQTSPRVSSTLPGSINPPLSVTTRGVFDAGITKRLATGGSAILKHRVLHNYSDVGSPPSNSLRGDYTATMQLRIDHPLLRGRGTFINRLPIMLARINEDISIADFEIAVRNQLLDVENAYWDLLCAYRNFETAKVGRDAAHRTWQNAYELLKGDRQNVQAESQAREQFHFFRFQLESALGTLLETEAKLRWLMGLAPTDGRLIRPVDDPVVADVQFAWNEIKTESLYRNVELRQQRWRLKQRELELANARHLLLPAVNLFAMHQWSGSGDELVTADRRGNNFHGNPADPLTGPVGSTAWDNMTEGDITGSFVGLEFLPPAFGARRELTRIRNAQLSLKREQARFEDMELQSIHLLSTAIRNKALNYRQMQTNLDRWAAADREITSARTAYEAGRAMLNNRSTLDILLDAQRRRALAQSDYYRSVCEYNKAIADLHFRKGSLLEYNGVSLAEGPWPEKAYWDALEKARQRDASYYFHYGWTRPGVISQGPVGQVMDEAPLPGAIHGEWIESPESLPETQGESAPANLPDPMDAPPEGSTIMPTSGVKAFQWGDLGLAAPGDSLSATSSPPVVSGAEASTLQAAPMSKAAEGPGAPPMGLRAVPQDVNPLR